MFQPPLSDASNQTTIHLLHVPEALRHFLAVEPTIGKVSSEKVSGADFNYEDARRAAVQKYLHQLYAVVRPLDAATGFSQGHFKSVDYADLVRHRNGHFHNAAYGGSPIDTQKGLQVVCYRDGGDEFFAYVLGKDAGGKPSLNAVFADISNLRGLNRALNGEAIGEYSIRPDPPEADKLLAIFGWIMQEELEAEAQKNPSHVSEARQRIELRINEIVHALGLQHILHPKHPDDPAYRGVRMAVSHMALGAVNNHEAVAAKLEEYLLKHKGKTDDMLYKKRAGETEGGPMQESMPLIEEKRLAGDSDAEKNADIERNSQGTVLRIRGETLKSIKARINALHATFVKKHPVKDTALFPFEGERIAASQMQQAELEWIHPAKSRAAKIEELKNRLKMNDTESSLLDMLYDAYESARAPDGISSEAPFEFIDRYIQRKTLRHLLIQGGTLPAEEVPVFALALSAENFTHLNHAFGHEGCNYIFKQAMRPLTMLVPQDRPYPLFAIRPNARGDKMYMVITGVQEKDITDLMRQLDKHVKDYARQMGMDGAPNVRYADNPYLQGFSVTTAAVRLDQGHYKSAKEVMNALETKINHQKKNPEWKVAQKRERLGWAGWSDLDGVKRPHVKFTVKKRQWEFHKKDKPTGRGPC